MMGAFRFEERGGVVQVVIRDDGKMVEVSACRVAEDGTIYGVTGEEIRKALFRALLLARQEGFDDAVIRSLLGGRGQARPWDPPEL